MVNLVRNDRVDGCPLGGTVTSDRPLRYRIGSRCARGGHREENEDKCYADATRGIFLVADGIGGYHGGAEASSVIVQTVPLVLQTAKEASRHDPPSMQMAIERSLEASHRRMVRFANRHPNYDRMGATTALAVVAGDTAYFTSVGDCRVYLARDNQLHRLTTDQTYVQAMLDAGVLSAAEARTSGFRNIVTNSVSVKGLQERPNVEAIPLQLGDRLLLVTDGLTNALDDEAIESMVFDGSPQETADELVLEALRQDSHDNIACVVVKVVNGRGST